MNPDNIFSSLDQVRADVEQLVSINQELTNEVNVLTSRLWAALSMVPADTSAGELQTLAQKMQLAFTMPASVSRSFEQFVQAQEPLGPDFEKIWDDNIETLYECDPTTSGWVHVETRLPSKEDAPSRYIYLSDGKTYTRIVYVDEYINNPNLREYWRYWHPSTGRFQIPTAPATESN